MSEALTPENFAAQLNAADTPEQPATDSDPAALLASEEGTQDAAEVATDEAQAEPEAEEGQQEQPETDSERVIKWQTASGEAIEATEAELKAGYLRQQDYTQKTQSVAEERKQAQATFQQQAQVVQALASEIGEYQVAQARLAPYASVDWRAWSQADPSAASAAYIEFQQAKDAASAAEAKVRAARGQLDQQQSQGFAQGVAAAEQRLTEKVKGVSRDEVLRMFGTAQKMGADQRTIDSIRSNPALAEMAIYAQRWMELQDKKPQVANKVKALPPAASQARPATVRNKGEEVAKAIASKRTFSAQDFAKMLKATR